MGPRLWIQNVGLGPNWVCVGSNLGLKGPLLVPMGPEVGRPKAQFGAWGPSLDPNLGRNLGPMCWVRFWASTLGPECGVQIWGPNLGSKFEAQTWVPHFGVQALGPNVGKQVCGPRIWIPNLGSQISDPKFGTLIRDQNLEPPNLGPQCASKTCVPAMGPKVGSKSYYVELWSQIWDPKLGSHI